MRANERPRIFPSARRLVAEILHSADEAAAWRPSSEGMHALMGLSADKLPVAAGKMHFRALKLPGASLSDGT